MNDNFSVPQPGMQTRLGPGSRIASYVIEKQVGAGGMAVVFRARDEALGRLAAVKVLSPALAASHEFRSRFERERRLLASVDESHILPVYAAGEADGVLYIATRFVSGGDLAGLLRRTGGPLDPERTASLITQVGAALDAVHAVGLLHRDVKPANVLIDTVPGRPEHAYLSDFGLSRAASSATGLTAPGVFMGTPDYCPPEQITGTPAVSARSDQYALACVAFSLLTGAVPYPREESIATLFAHVKEPVPVATGLRPELGVAVDAVLARAMAKDPAERYPTCGEFADALRDAVRPPAVPPAPPPAPEPVPVPPSLPPEPVSVPPSLPREPVSVLPSAAPELVSVLPSAAPGPVPVLPSREPATVSVLPSREPETVPVLPSAASEPVSLPPTPGPAPPPSATAVGEHPPTELAADGRAAGTGSAAYLETIGVPSESGATVPPLTGPPVTGGTLPPVTGGIGTVPAKPARSHQTAIVIWAIISVVVLVAGITTGIVLSGSRPGGQATLCTSGATATPAAGAAALPVPNGDCVYGVTAFSQDGTLVAGESGNNLYSTFYVWNAVTHAYVTTLTFPSSALVAGNYGLAFSPDDKTLTAADEDGDIYQWDLATGTGSSLYNLASTVNAPLTNNVALSGDGSTLAVTDNAGDGADIINLATGKVTADLTDPGAAPVLGVNTSGSQTPGTAFSLSDDGSFLTVGDSRGNLYVWNVRAQQVIATLRYNPAAAGARSDAAATISGDGKFVLVPDGPLGQPRNSLWDVATRASVTPHDARWPGGNSTASALFSYGGQFIATEDGTGGADLWNAATRAHIASIPFSISILYLYGVSPDGKQILTTDFNNNPYTWAVP